MKIWSVVNQKGGSGKSTLVSNLAVAAVNANLVVAIIDADPQASTATWNDWRRHVGAPDLCVVATPAVRIKSALPDMERLPADLVLIDTPPHANSAASDAMKEATQILIPCAEDLFDMYALEHTLQTSRLFPKEKPPIVILNRTSSRAKVAIDRVTDTILQQATQANVKIDIAPHRLNFRKTYPAAIARGFGVCEMNAASAFDARREVERLFAFLAARDGIVFPAEDAA